MHEFIDLRIPGGCISPESQVDQALTGLVTAAELLDFCGLTELENALSEMRESLLLLARAGELAQLSFHLHEPNGLVGVRVIIDPYGVADYEEVDLSSLRLLASPQALGHIDIVCADSEFVAGFVGTDWLARSSDTLSFGLTFGNDNDTFEENEKREEECDDDDNGFEAWREPLGEIDDL